MVTRTHTPLSRMSLFLGGGQLWHALQSQRTALTQTATGVLHASVQNFTSSCHYSLGLSAPSDSLPSSLPHACQQQHLSNLGTFSSTGACQASPQQLRGLKVLRRVFPLPPAVQSVLDAQAQAASAESTQKQMPVILDPSTPRALSPESLRVGCIAYKAGMTQEWDEHGVRVPLTVLWVDDCQVRRLTRVWESCALQIKMSVMSNWYHGPCMWRDDRHVA
jgi:hypothetical protein